MKKPRKFSLKRCLTYLSVALFFLGIVLMSSEAETLKLQLWVSTVGLLMMGIGAFFALALEGNGR